MFGWRLQRYRELARVFALFAIIVVAFGLMLGIFKPAEAFKRIAIIAGTVIVLFLLPQIVLRACRSCLFFRS